MDRQYITLSSKETKSDEEIKQAPKKKGVFLRVVREKKEEQKKQPKKEPPWKTPKITIVHKRKPKVDEPSKPKENRRTSKKKLDAQDIIDQIINDGNLDNISTFYDDFDDKGKNQLEKVIVLYLDSLSRTLIELDKILPKELHDKLEVIKLHAQNLDWQIKETKLVNLYLSITPPKIVDLINKIGSNEFNPKHRINNLMFENFEEIWKETIDIWVRINLSLGYEVVLVL